LAQAKGVCACVCVFQSVTFVWWIAILIFIYSHPKHLHSMWGIWGRCYPKMKIVAYFLAPHKIQIFIKAAHKSFTFIFNPKKKACCRKLLC